MRIFKKTCWVLLSFCMIGLLSCINCNCEPYSEKAIIIVDALEANHVNHFGDIIKENDTINNWDHRFIRLNYKVQEIALNLHYQSSFSIFPSAYAWSCNCDYPVVYFKNIYPSKIRIITIYDLNNENSAGSVVNKLFEMPFVTSNVENTKFDSLDVVNKPFYIKNISTVEDDFYLDFALIDKSVLQNDSLQFIIETTLSTGGIFTIQTPLIRLK